MVPGVTGNFLLGIPVVILLGHQMMVTHDGDLLLELFQQSDLLRGEVPLADLVPQLSTDLVRGEKTHLLALPATVAAKHGVVLLHRGLHSPLYTGTVQSGQTWDTQNGTRGE